MMVFLRRLALVAFAIGVPLWLNNSSTLAPEPEGTPDLIAHRGLGQLYDRTGLTNQTCTAERMNPARHHYLENTLTGIRAAFDAGAEIVEIDVHLTRDGHFAVFHDWTLDCRTNGTGETRAASLAELRALDIGYGYTPDNGQTFPFRGRAVGLMPDLPQTLAAFPKRRFLIEFKEDATEVGHIFLEKLEENPVWDRQIWGVYSGPTVLQIIDQTLPGNRTYTRRNTTDCLTHYGALGWSGYIPQACRNTTVYIPINVAPWLWGWPNRFLSRMQDAGTRVVLMGPYMRGDVGGRSFDDPDLLSKLPTRFNGYIQTDRADLIGSLLFSP